MKRTIDILVSDLCEEIDYWKEEAEKYRMLYNQEIRERAVKAHEDFENTKRGVANALLFALSARDDENGNLVIPAEERKQLAQNWRE